MIYAMQNVVNGRTFFFCRRTPLLGISGILKQHPLIAHDVECLGIEAFHIIPLTGFLTKREALRVRNSMAKSAVLYGNGTYNKLFKSAGLMTAREWLVQVADKLVPVLPAL